LTVLIGDKRVDYNPAFRLFLTTRNPAPSLSPDAAALLCVTNFTVTRSGLESQLLAATLQHEQPELEQQRRCATRGEEPGTQGRSVGGAECTRAQRSASAARTAQLTRPHPTHASRSALLARQEAMSAELAALNQQLLTSLSSAEGDILENTKLVASLDDTKVKASDIAAALASSAAVRLDLERQRNAYARVARAAASMYFALSDLRAVNGMYQFSLKAFTGLFASALHSSARSADLQLRLAAIVPVSAARRG